MSTLKGKKFVQALLILVVTLAVGLVIAEIQTKALERLYDEFVLDNYNHYLPCEALPLAGEAVELVRQHQEEVRRILAVNPGQVGVEMDTTTCPGRADLLIWYASHSDRMEIEAMLDERLFYGIPVRLENR